MADSEDKRCWLCCSPNPILWKERNLKSPLRAESLRITDQEYGTTLRLLKCPHCGFIFAQGTELAELHLWYEQLTDPEYENTQETRALQMRWLLKKMVACRPDAKSLLDIGAGTGLLVAEAHRMGLEAVGIEPSRSLVEAAARINGVSLQQGCFPDPTLSGKRFDVVCLVDVIEHMAQPGQTLSSCATLVNPEGALVIVTPDVSSLVARVLGQKWWHFRPAHVCYFNRRSMALALDMAGLSPIRWLRTKWFFPMSYLAERVARYLPMRRINELGVRIPGFRRVYKWVVPLNLYDSWLVIAAPKPQQERDPHDRRP
jgi:2-polyprenyl-3-methyl-5-hydroxy-6-metoxy-1,4-benzoquinol methylase